MKTRNGFISNSSSSSFIISINNKNNEPCKCCGRTDIDILKLIDKFKNDRYDNDTEVIAFNYTESLGYIKSNLLMNDSEFNDLIIKINDEYESGNEIAIISIEYHDEIIHELYKIQLGTKKIKEIEKVG
jgi:hypothetical protein